MQKKRIVEYGKIGKAPDPPLQVCGRAPVVAAPSRSWDLTDLRPFHGAVRRIRTGLRKDSMAVPMPHQADATRRERRRGFP